MEPVQWLRSEGFRWLLHPAWILLGGLVLTQALGDANYPFSNFPMYSRLDDEGTLIHLADGTEKPLSTYRHVSLSAAKVNKIFHSNLRKICRRERVRITRAPQRLLQEAADETLTTLRRINAEHSLPPLPDEVHIMRTSISIEGGKLIQETRKVGQG